MSDEDYSSKADKIYFRKLKREKKKEQQRMESTYYERRPYSKTDEDFARRLNAGSRFGIGDI